MKLRLILSACLFIACRITANAQPSRPSLPDAGNSEYTFGKSFELDGDRYNPGLTFYDLFFLEDGKHIQVELGFYNLIFNWRTGELVDYADKKKTKLTNSYTPYKCSSESKGMRQIMYDNSRKRLTAKWDISAYGDRYSSYVVLWDEGGKHLKKLYEKDFYKTDNSIPKNPIGLYLDGQRPVFAYIMRSPFIYGVSSYYTDIVIQDLAADTVICKLKNAGYAMAMAGYKEEYARYQKDSADYAQNIQSALDARKVLYAGFIKQAEEKLQLLQQEGWRLEKKFNAADTRDYSDDAANFNKYRVQTEANRVYMTVAMTYDSRISFRPRTYLNGDQAANLSSNVWVRDGWIGYSNFFKTDDNLSYIHSAAAYTIKPMPLHFYLYSDCFCTEKTAANGFDKTDPDLVMAILSKPKPAGKKLSSKVLPESQIDIVNLQQSYDSTIAAIKKAAEPVVTIARNSKTDSASRKSILASLKKKMITPGIKLQQEIWMKEIDDNGYLKLELNYPANMKRTVFVISERAGNFARYKVDMEGIGEYIESDGDNHYDMNGYSVSRISFTGPANIAWVNTKDNKATAFSVLVFTEKDDKGYAAIKKELEEINKNKEEENKNSRQRLSNEVFDAKEKIERIRTQVNYFVNNVQAILDEINSRAERDNWGWDQYTSRFNDMTAKLDKLRATTLNNMIAVSEKNPEYNKFFNWTTAFTDKYKTMLEKKESLEKHISNDKKPSLAAFRFAFQDIISTAKQMYNLSY